MWSVAGALLPHLQQLSSVQLTVMRGYKLSCLFTNHLDVYIARQRLNHPEPNSGSEHGASDQALDLAAVCMLAHPELGAQTGVFGIGEERG